MSSSVNTGRHGDGCDTVMGVDRRALSWHQRDMGRRSSLRKLLESTPKAVKLTVCGLKCLVCGVQGKKSSLHLAIPKADVDSSLASKSLRQAIPPTTWKVK